MPDRLILIRHSQSAADPAVPVHLWNLTDEGRHQCRALATHLARFSPTLVCSSPEPKALETATLTLQHLGRDPSVIHVIDGLREHARKTLAWMPSQEAFDAKLREFFARPDARVIGEETASQALLRFTRAIAGIAAEVQSPAPADTAPGQDVFAFTHATVMTLFVAACTEQDAFAFWRSLGMPAFVVLMRRPEASSLAFHGARATYTLEQVTPRV